jgi:protein gp37
MGKTKIEWASSSWNPIIVSGECQDAFGRFYCTPVSPGCDHCYASAMNARLFGGVKYQYNLKTMFPALVFNDKIPRFKPGERVFVGSMFDLFHDAVPDELINRLFDIINSFPDTVFMLLTKRALRLKHIKRWPKNVQLGVSVESQEYVWRIQKLLECDAAVRFVSFEPLIANPGIINLSGIDGAIVGGETGPGARPMDSDWARSIRDQCVASGIPFFFKSFGEFVDSSHPEWSHRVFGKSPSLGKIVYMDSRGKILDPPPKDENADCGTYVRVGKARAGRLLDGRGWNQLPGEKI